MLRPVGLLATILFGPIIPARPVPQTPSNAVSCSEAVAHLPAPERLLLTESNETAPDSSPHLVPFTHFGGVDAFRVAGSSSIVLVYQDETVR